MGHIFLKNTHGLYNLRQTNFKDFSWTKIYLPYWLKGIMESFTIFISLSIVDHIILKYFLQQDFAKWLGMTCNCIWGMEIAFEIKRQK